LALASIGLACERQYAEAYTAHSLPIVKLNIDENYLWSADSGLYVVGTYSADTPNFDYKWEYPAKVSFINFGEEELEEQVGFRIKGNSTRYLSEKSFGLYWRSEYGKSSVDYPFFPQNEISHFKRLLIRTSASDYTHLKDVAICAIVRDDIRLDFQDYQACALYLNKEYWGLYYLREMITPHHFENHYGVDRDSVDLLQGEEVSPTVDDGSAEAFVQEVINYIDEHNLADSSAYQTLSERIDIQSYMDYIIVNTYIAKGDWPWSNGKWWRARGDASYQRWRWVFYDSDWSFRMENVHDVYMGDLYGQSFESGVTDNFFLFNHLILNTEFREAFLERYLYFIEQVFEEQRVEDIIYAIKAEVEDEYQRHAQKWGQSDGIVWDIAVKQMISFNNERHDYMKSIIKELQNENN